MQEDKGRYGKYEGNRFDDKVETLGVNIPLEILRDAITAVCLDKLGFAWDMRYGEIIQYKEQFGHCNVPRDWTENKPLASWVNQQRLSYQKRKLSEDRIKRLEDLGFMWNPYESQWEEMFVVLIEYKKMFGHCNVPKNWPDNKPLANWAGNQRSNYQEGKLSEDRIKRLEDIGVVWEVLESKWEEMFEALKEYKNNHGHCNVLFERTENKLLYNWVSRQRKAYRNRILRDDRIKRLEEIGFVWDILESQWEEMFEALKA